ncbi:MAG: tetratricopeptide repeat protein [Bacteroidaceae bacterium]|nr:tetratricopeptide repeat protein [Bacteroidaceae bacterium]
MFKFIKSVLTGEVQTPEEKQQEEQERSFDTLKYDGIRAVNLRQYDYAQQCLSAAIAIKKDAEAMEYLARLYDATSHEDEALNLWNELATLFPDDSKYQLLAAAAYYQRGEYGRVIEICQHVRNIDPENISAFYYSARAHNQQGDQLMAIAELTQALTIESSQPNLLLLRATILHEMGQLADAEKDIDEILTHQEGCVEEAMMLKGEIQLAQGNAEEAQTHFIRLIELNPFNHQAYLMLAETYIRQQAYEKALSVYTDAIEQLPELAQAYYGRGRVQHLMGNLQASVADLKRAMEIDPEIEKNISGKFQKL